MKTEEIVLQGRASTAGEDAPRVSVELPGSFQEAVDVWGEEKAEALFAAGLKDAVQRFAKSRFTAGMAPEVLQETMVGWQPGVRATRSAPKPVRKVSSALRAVGKLTDEEMAALREQLRQDERFAALL